MSDTHTEREREREREREGFWRLIFLFGLTLVHASPEGRGRPVLVEDERLLLFLVLIRVLPPALQTQARNWECSSLTERQVVRRGDKKAMLPAAALAAVAVRGDFHIPLHHRDRHAARLKESRSARLLEACRGARTSRLTPLRRRCESLGWARDRFLNKLSPLLPFRALFEREKQFCWHHWLE